MTRVLLLLSVLIFAGSSHAAPKAEDLLRAMRQAERKVSYSATQTRTRVGASATVARIQRKGAKRRVEYSAPAIMRGDVMLHDGKTVWSYRRAENSALKTTAAPRMSRNWNALRSRFNAKMQGQTRIIGRKAWIVALVPKGKTRPTRKFWIDDATKIRLRSETFDGNGKRLESWALSNLKIGNISDAVFKWSTPRGAKVSNAGTLYMRLERARSAATWLRVPTKLPRGYAFESAVINGGKSEAWLRYSNSVRRFSIFQQRTSQSKNTAIKRAGGGWYWQTGRDRFLIAGLPEAQAKQVAGSVK